MKKLVFMLLSVIVLMGLTACASPSNVERHIKKKTKIELNLSGCKIEQEIDTHGGMGNDGTLLFVLDCRGNEEKLLAQISGWPSFPLSGSLQKMMYGRSRSAERIELPQIDNGAWYFYDRFPDTVVFDRSSDELLFSRPAHNFSLLLFDSDHSKLYYFEEDT